MWVYMYAINTDFTRPVITQRHVKIKRFFVLALILPV